MMCDDSDDPANCKKVITKSLLCTSFLEKAQSLSKDQVAGVDNFIARCKSIERQVPNLSSVFHWVQNPEEVFQNVVHKAEGKTGITMNGAISALQEADKSESYERLNTILGDVRCCVKMPLWSSQGPCVRL